MLITILDQRSNNVRFLKHIYTAEGGSEAYIRFCYRDYFDTFEWESIDLIERSSIRKHKKGKTQNSSGKLKLFHRDIVQQVKYKTECCCELDKTRTSVHPPSENVSVYEQKTMEVLDKDVRKTLTPCKANLNY